MDRQAQHSQQTYSLKFLTANTPKIYIHKIRVSFHKILCERPYLKGWYTKQKQTEKYNSNSTEHNIIHIAEYLIIVQFYTILMIVYIFKQVVYEFYESCTLKYVFNIIF